MKRLAYLTMTFMLIAALVSACAGAASPAAAPAAQAPAAEEAAGSGVEMPQPDPADEALEATPEPVEERGDAASGATNAAGVRTFQFAPGASSMQYFVDEEFFGQAVPFITAIGKTSELQGDLALRFDGANVAIEQGTFTADISTLTSDRPRRDQAIRTRWLESSRFPIATFVATDVTNLPADAAFGRDVSFQVQGDMTIREVTNPITWDMTARIDDSTLTGVATTFFYMKDYGFDPPDVAGMLRVTDGVTVTVNFVAQEVQ